MPFGNEVGRSLIAHLYNADAARRGGLVEVVYTCKQRSEGRWIEDLERGVMAKVNPDPWQTDTSIGDWYYNKNWKFRPVSWVIHMLVDIVSKNGKLLLNKAILNAVLYAWPRPSRRWWSCGTSAVCRP